jgi:hypothetical protein
MRCFNNSVRRVGEYSDAYNRLRIEEPACFARVEESMKTVIVAFCTMLATLCVAWLIFTPRVSMPPLSPATIGDASKSATPSAPASPPKPKPRQLTVDSAGCWNVYGSDQPAWMRLDVCQARAHQTVQGHRVNLSLMCNVKHATCQPLTPGDVYEFQVVSGLRECGKSVGKVYCVEIHGRPYNTVYTATLDR